MGLMDELKRLARPYADDEDYDEEYEDEMDEELEEPEEAPAPARPARSAARQQEAPSARPAVARPVSSGMGTASVGSMGSASLGGIGNVVNLHSGINLQVMLVKPDRYENVSEVADHLRNKCAVVLNLESTNKDTARRLVDFLSGCAYALDGKIKKVALSTYLITPFGVDIVGDLKDEIESAAAYY